MPKADAVVSYRSPPDPQRLADYSKLAVPAIEPVGARILARGDAVVALEHGQKERTVVVEYPSLEQAVAAYSSAGAGIRLDVRPAGFASFYRLARRGASCFRKRSSISV